MSCDPLCPRCKFYHDPDEKCFDILEIESKRIILYEPKGRTLPKKEFPTLNRKQRRLRFKDKN